MHLIGTKWPFGKFTYELVAGLEKVNSSRNIHDE